MGRQILVPIHNKSSMLAVGGQGIETEPCCIIPIDDGYISPVLILDKVKIPVKGTTPVSVWIDIYNQQKKKSLCDKTKLKVTDNLYEYVTTHTIICQTIPACYLSNASIVFSRAMPLVLGPRKTEQVSHKRFSHHTMTQGALLFAQMSLSFLL